LNLRILSLDFETFYGDDYTLSKMTTEGYVRDPRFQTIGIGVFESATGERLWMAHDVFTYWAARQDWSNIALICHHAQFDGLILAHHYNIRPRFWFCTLSMARSIHGTGKISLAKLGGTYGVGVKGDDVVKAKGKRYENFASHEWLQYGNYCLNDCQLTYEIFIRMLQHFSRDELELIDLTIRMFTEPAFILDAALLEQGVRDEIAAKEILLSKAETSKDVLMSNDKFAALLFEIGAEVPQKISPASLKPDKNGVLGDPKYTWAFAKTDPGFKKLLEHEDDVIRWVAEARVGVKSTLKETRSQRLAEMAHRGLAPVYLNYAGAHTGRWSGGDKVNLQNLPRKGILRKAVMAPDGHVVVVCDSAQIEARTLGWLAGHESLVAAFRDGRDVYSELATIIYQRPINRKRKEIINGVEVEPDFTAGFVGKTATLGLGFQLGWPKFAMTMLQGANGGPSVLFDKPALEDMKIDPNPFLNNKKNVEKAFAIPTRYSQKQMLVHCIVSKHIVDTYRKANHPIVQFWDLCSQMIDNMYDGCNTEWLGGLIQTRKSELVLPSGRVLRYRELHFVPKTQKEQEHYKFKSGREWTKLYGGLLCENITQAVARDLVARQALEYAKTGRKVASTTHDEVQSVVQTSDGATALNVMLSIMKRPQQSWAQGVPLSAEGGFARVYADAKP
jgi:DNA polymerase